MRIDPLYLESLEKQLTLVIHLLNEKDDSISERIKKATNAYTSKNNDYRTELTIIDIQHEVANIDNLCNRLVEVRKRLEVLRRKVEDYNGDDSDDGSPPPQSMSRGRIREAEMERGM